MARYALRADVFNQFQLLLCGWLSGVANGWIVAYEEAGDNKHIHAIIDSELSEKQLRNRFIRKFPDLSGNKGYSLKKCDDNWDAYIRYICKGDSVDKPPVIWSRQGLLYTDKHIADAHAQYYVNQEAVVLNAKKRKAVEKASIVEQVEAEAKRLGYTANHRVDVARIYLRLFRDARKGINVFAARAVVNTVCLLLDDASLSETLLANKIADI